MLLFHNLTSTQAVNSLLQALELYIPMLLFVPVHLRRKNYRIRFLIGICLALLGALIFNQRSLQVLLSQTGSLLVITRYAVLIACSALMVWILARPDAYSLLLVLVGGCSLRHLAYSVNRLISAILFYLGIPNFGSSDTRAFYYILMVLLYFLLDKLLIQKIRSSESSARSWGMLLTAGVVLLNLLIFDLNVGGFDDLQKVLFRIMSILESLMILFFMEKSTENILLKKDVQFIEELLKQKENYYETMKQSIEQANIYFHDLKHQFQRQLPTMDQNPDSKLYSSKTADPNPEARQLLQQYEAMAHTGNDVLDVVLTEKKMQADLKQIQFTYLADGSLIRFLSRQDTYALFGNILDNAIEASEKVPDSARKVINLSIRRSSGFVQIQCYNYFEGCLQMENGLPVTTKAEKSQHGFGTKSILYIAKKYQGECYISAEDGLFSMQILLPVAD